MPCMLKRETKLSLGMLEIFFDRLNEKVALVERVNEGYMSANYILVSLRCVNISFGYLRTIVQDSLSMTVIARHWQTSG